MGGEARLDEIDLLDPGGYVDGPPHHLFRRLRADDPVHWHPEGAGGFWAVTGYADVQAVSRDSATYSSWLRGTMITDPDDLSLDQLRQMMLNMDPPEHTKLRLLVNRGFTPRRIARLRDGIDRLAASIVDAVAADGGCDFVTQVAGELPSAVIAELLGIPRDDGRRLYELTERIHEAVDGVGGEAAAADGMAAVMEMMVYAHDLALRKRREPADDIVTALLEAEVDGERLTDVEFNLFFMLLLNAGGDTTRNLVAGGVAALLDHRDQYDRLVADRTLLPGAIEELLRWCSPVIHFRRTATTDTVLAGRSIAPGDKVVVWYASANRDEAVFDRPDELDLGRHPNDHLAFGGGGAHYCLGANLARVEITALLTAVLDRLHDLRPAGPVERSRSTFINGVRHLSVTFTPAP